MARHMCRVDAARADLREREMCRGGRNRAAPRAAPGRRADLRCRAGRAMSADDGGCRPHGPEAARGRPLRALREAPRYQAYLRGQVRPPDTPSQGAVAGHVAVRDVRETPRPDACVQAAVRLQGPPPPAGHRGAEGEAQAGPGQAGGPAQAGRGRAACPRESPQGRGPQAEAASGPAAGRPARAGDLRGQGLPEVRVPGVLAGRGELPAAPWRLTC